jgi:hypothetical protein
VTAPVPVRPGQIWADTDWRNKGRTVRILDVGIRYATYEVATEADAPWTSRSTVGRQSRVEYGPRGPRGYRLVSEPDDPAGSTT